MANSVVCVIPRAPLFSPTEILIKLKKVAVTMRCLQGLAFSGVCRFSLDPCRKVQKVTIVLMELCQLFLTATVSLRHFQNGVFKVVVQVLPQVNAVPPARVGLVLFQVSQRRSRVRNTWRMCRDRSLLINGQRTIVCVCGWTRMDLSFPSRPICELCFLQPWPAVVTLWHCPVNGIHFQKCNVKII